MITTTFLVKYKKMKILSLFLLIFSTLLLYNCEEPFSVVENQLIENIYLFDIDNKGSSADLCLTFTNTQTAQISSYRVMLIPVEKINEFSASKAFLLAPESYTESPITSNKNNVIYFKNQLDTEGDLIIPNKYYIAKIMMIGENFNQLSLLNSNVGILTNQAPLTGYYEGRLRTNMTASGAFLSPGNERILTLSGTIKQLEDPDSYSGSFQFRIPNNNFGNTYYSGESGSLRFSYLDHAISSLEGSGFILNYVVNYTECLEECLENCIGSFSGQLTNGIRLSIIGEGCDIGLFELVLLRSVELDEN
jgi:hypothetical protein